VAAPVTDGPVEDRKGTVSGPLAHALVVHWAEKRKVSRSVPRRVGQPDQQTSENERGRVVLARPTSPLLPVPAVARAPQRP